MKIRNNPLGVKAYIWKKYWRATPWKMKAMERDGYKCIKCGKKPPTTKLHIHHLDGNGHQDKDFNGLENNDLSNLITLCVKCHALEHKVEFKMNPNLEMMQEMRNQGLSYQDIGNEFKISRQRVHQLLKGYINSRGKKVISNCHLTACPTSD